ncbi:hypothetical protein DH2020_029931 [Rehmannia glutinosa]|uniref:Transcription factor CBF/NF-Y/archaeal histone domain-containing protein n=1 Tax=Rehmannia glutinosa TaxID=99300 RepID=A0ABR0VM42_REHGL
MADSPGGYGVGGGSGSHDNGGDGDQSPRSNVREQDRFLPIANIGRIMKKALPANGKIAKDAKDTVQECVSEFISFVTSEASDKCREREKKDNQWDDLLWAMATLGFEDYITPPKPIRQVVTYLQGDTKGSVRGTDGSAKKDATGTQLHSDAQVTFAFSFSSLTQQIANIINLLPFAHQGSFSQGFSYSNSQIEY